jgi:1,4-dihydroxy-6-naphthoate synthase
MTTYQIAHSPDTDDLIMFAALKAGKIHVPENTQFEFHAHEIQFLNKWAKEERFDITALSAHAYAHLSDHYAITMSGASMAEKDWGPLIVTKPENENKPWSDVKIAIPGELTTANLLLKIAHPEVQTQAIPIEEILPAVKDGQFDAGLIIHEGQILYKDFGLIIRERIIDEWKKHAGDLPLPLGVSAVKKSLGPEKMKWLSELQTESIVYAREHWDEVIPLMREIRPELDEKQTELYLSWYVNDRTVRWDAESRQALKKLYDLAFERHLIPNQVNIEIV